MGWSPGMQIGPFILEKPVRWHGVGEVWRATWQHSEHPEVDLKLYEDAAVHELDVIQREVAALKAINHPCYPKPLDAAVDELSGTRYLATTMPPEGSLSLFQIQSDRGGTLEVREACLYVALLLEALDPFHKAGVVHCDLKPDTVMFTPAGDPWIIDLEIALVSESRLGGGRVAGTLQYMAPEQMSPDTDIDCRADLYAVGRILLELLTQPFAAEPVEGVEAFLWRTFNEGSPPLLLFRPDVPVSLDSVHRRLIARHPSDRFSSAEEACDALRLVIESLPEQPTAQPNSQTPAVFETRPSLGVIQAAGARNQCGRCGKSNAWHNVFCQRCGAPMPRPVVSRSTQIPLLGAVPPPAPTASEPPPSRPSLLAPAPLIAPAASANSLVHNNQLSPSQTIPSSIPQSSTSHSSTSQPSTSQSNTSQSSVLSTGTSSTNSNTQSQSAPKSTPVPPSSPVPPSASTSPNGSVPQSTPVPQSNQPVSTLANPPAPRSSVPGSSQTAHSKRPAESGWPLSSFSDEPSLPRIWREIATPVAFGESRTAGTQGQVIANQALKSVRIEQFSLLEAGTVLSGRWIIRELLGRGGNADVYLLEDTWLYGEYRAAKIIRVEGDPLALLSALRHSTKFWRLVSLRAPNSVVLLNDAIVLKSSTGREVAALIMEPMAGGSLLQLAKRTAGTRARSREDHFRILRFFIQTCRSVAELHELGLVHRDIKPSNILLNDAQTQCKLSDFDLLTSTGSAHSEPFYGGTPAFLAPEVMNGRFTPSADVFALGATLYQLLTGEVPIDETTGPRRNAPDPCSVDPLIPRDLGRLVKRCLDPRPGARPQNARELLVAIEKLGLHESLSTDAPSRLATTVLGHVADDEINDLMTIMASTGVTLGKESVDKVKLRELVLSWCHTTSPEDILRETFTLRQLSQIARQLGIENTGNRDSVIGQILTSLGFTITSKEVPSISALKVSINERILALTHVTSEDELVGIVHVAQTAIDRIIDIYLKFFVQMIYASAANHWLAGISGVSAERLTTGQKIHILRALCIDHPVTLPVHLMGKLVWPLLPSRALDALGELIGPNQPSGEALPSIVQWQKERFTIIEQAFELMAKEAILPEVFRVAAMHQDSFGRISYDVRHESGRLVRLTPMNTLQLGQLYLGINLLAQRVDPIVVPFEMTGR